VYYLESINQHVRGLGTRWVDAERRGDAETLAELVTRDFVFVGPRGTLIDRNRYLYARSSGELIHYAFNWDDVVVRVYPDAAVAVGELKQLSTFRGADASGVFRATQVVVRQANHWDGLKVASLQLTPIARQRAT